MAWKQWRADLYESLLWLLSLLLLLLWSVSKVGVAGDDFLVNCQDQERNQENKDPPVSLPGFYKSAVVLKIDE